MQPRAKDTTVFLAAMIRYAISSNDGALLHNLHRRRNLSFLRNNEILKPKLYILQTRSDILLLCTGSRPFAVDFAVTSPLQPKFISGAAQVTGFAAERYSEDVKEMKYEADFEELDIEFKPIVLETLVLFVAED